MAAGDTVLTAASDDAPASDVPGGPDGCAAALNDLGYAEGTGEVLSVDAEGEYPSIQGRGRRHRAR